MKINDIKFNEFIEKRSEIENLIFFGGSGYKFDQTIRAFKGFKLEMPIAICDNDINKQNNSIYSIPIISFEEALDTYDDLYIAISTSGYKNEIIEQIGNKIPSNKIIYFKEGDLENVIYNKLENEYWPILEKMPKLSGSGEYSNKVWWCWLQGEENAPTLCKACLQSLRNNLVDKEIIIITNDNLYDYIDFPDYIKVKYKDGIISHTHFSDLVRLQLLIKHGGTWIDSSVFVTGNGENIFNQPLFVYRAFVDHIKPHILANWLIYAEKQNPILITTRDLLFLYWEENNNLIDYFLFHRFFYLVTKKYKTEWDNVKVIYRENSFILRNEQFNKLNKERVKDFEQMADFHKLLQKDVLSNNIENSFYNKYILQVLEK